MRGKYTYEMRGTYPYKRLWNAFHMYIDTYVSIYVHEETRSTDVYTGMSFHMYISCAFQHTHINVSGTGLFMYVYTYIGVLWVISQVAFDVCWFLWIHLGLFMLVFTFIGLVWFISQVAFNVCWSLWMYVGLFIFVFTFIGLVWFISQVAFDVCRSLWIYVGHIHNMQHLSIHNMQHSKCAGYSNSCKHTELRETYT